MSNDFGKRGGLTIGTVEQHIRGRVVASLRPGELALQVVWGVADEKHGGIFPVPLEIVAEDARMPNTPVWMQYAGPETGYVRVWRRDGSA